MLPAVGYRLEYPDVLQDSASVKRLHNKAGREAMRKELIKHHRERVPLHFDANNRTRYNHMPRKEGYKAYKFRRYHSRTDLVLTGRTRDAMRRMYQLRIGGTASGATGLTGTLTLRFPFTNTESFRIWQKKTFGNKNAKAAYMERRASRVGVTIDQMRKEISTVVDGEQKAIADGLGATYTQIVNAELASCPRLRKVFR